MIDPMTQSTVITSFHILITLKASQDLDIALIYLRNDERSPKS